MVISGLQWLSSPKLILLWMLAWCTLAVLLFWVENIIEPFPQIDFWFFLRLHAMIGGVAGGLTWYIPRLVLLGRIKFRTVTIFAVLPYTFLMITALDQNPPLGVFITFLLLVLLKMAALATHGRAEEIDSKIQEELKAETAEVKTDK